MPWWAVGGNGELLTDRNLASLISKRNIEIFNFDSAFVLPGVSADGVDDVLQNSPVFDLRKQILRCNLMVPAKTDSALLRVYRLIWTRLIAITNWMRDWSGISKAAPSRNM